MTNNGVQGAGSSQDLNVCSLMGGGPQAVLYSLMNSILEIYSKIRAECSELAQDLVSAQSACTTASSKATQNAGQAQADQCYADAAQSFGAAVCSFGQLGVNMKGVGTKQLSEEHDNLSKSAASQQKLLDMANDPETFNKPVSTASVEDDMSETASNASFHPCLDEEGHAELQQNEQNVQAAKKNLMEHLGEDNGRDPSLDAAAIRAMKNGDDETELSKFKDDLRASIRHKQTLMTEKTQQMSYVREMINTITQGTTNAIGGVTKAYSGVEANNAGQYNAAKTVEDYCAQSAGEGVQTFTESLRHYYDLVAGLIQSTAAAARATPQ